MKPIALGLTLAFGLIPTASAADCLDVATKALEAKGITDLNRSEPPMLEQVVMVQNIAMGYRAWFRVDRCQNGYVIVNMNTSCTVSSIWTKGDCDPELRELLDESP